MWFVLSVCGCNSAALVGINLFVWRAQNRPVTDAVQCFLLNFLQLCWLTVNF